MSQENGEVVRQPITVRAHSRRRLDESLAMRFPRALAFLARAYWRLPPRSRLRQAIIRRAAQLSAEAINRGDYEAAFGLWHPDCESIFPPQMTMLGDQPGTRGREDRVRFQRSWSVEWGEVRFEPEEVFDLGDRLLGVGRIK